MPYPEKYITAGNVLYKNRKNPFVQRILIGEKQPVFDYDDQGRPMTHLMTSIDNFALPLLQYDQRTAKWTDLRNADINSAFDESIKSGNYIEFNTPEEANAFGKDYHFVMNDPGLIGRIKQNKRAFMKYLRK